MYLYTIYTYRSAKVFQFLIEHRHYSRRIIANGIVKSSSRPLYRRESSLIKIVYYISCIKYVYEYMTWWKEIIIFVRVHETLFLIYDSLILEWCRRLWDIYYDYTIHVYITTIMLIYIGTSYLCKYIGPGTRRLHVYARHINDHIIL